MWCACLCLCIDAVFVDIHVKQIVDLCAGDFQFTDKIHKLQTPFVLIDT